MHISGKKRHRAKRYVVVRKNMLYIPKFVGQAKTFRRAMLAHLKVFLPLPGVPPAMEKDKRCINEGSTKDNGMYKNLRKRQFVNTLLRIITKRIMKVVTQNTKEFNHKW